MNAWKQIRAVLLLPFMVTVVIPAAIVYSARFKPIHPIRLVIGAALLVLGLTLLIATIKLFATVGNGTLAPWNPTQKLVVRGIYRHVPNPMITGVILILLGEAIICASLLGWAMLFIVVNMTYIPLVEEPGLVNRFGAPYEEYRRNVPRWIPRARAWGP